MYLNVKIILQRLLESRWAVYCSGTSRFQLQVLPRLQSVSSAVLIIWGISDNVVTQVCHWHLARDAVNHVRRRGCRLPGSCVNCATLESLLFPQSPDQAPQSSPPCLTSRSTARREHMPLHKTHRLVLTLCLGQAHYVLTLHIPELCTKNSLKSLMGLRMS